MYSQTGRPSLKELCPEDKHRVRLLIEQLAKTSCEKEAMEDQVKEERKQFAMLLEKLKKQHHKVVKEKKDILLLHLNKAGVFNSIPTPTLLTKLTHQSPLITQCLVTSHKCIHVRNIIPPPSSNSSPNSSPTSTPSQVK